MPKQQEDAERPREQSAGMPAAPDVVAATAAAIPPDWLLVLRIASLADRDALAALDTRHGLTLYALAYALTFDRYTADAAVSAAFREVWRLAGSYDRNAASVQQWLAEITRRTAREWSASAARLAKALSPRPATPTPLVTAALHQKRRRPWAGVRSRLAPAALWQSALGHVRSVLGALRGRAPRRETEPLAPGHGTGQVGWPLRAADSSATLGTS